MKRVLLLVAAVVASSLVPSTGMTQQLSDYINVRIINDRGSDLRISAYDNVCGVMLLEKRLARSAEISAQLCTQGMDKGDVTVRNLETGAERRYQSVLRGARLAAP
jgi:hypothetical protein